MHNVIAFVLLVLVSEIISVPKGPACPAAATIKFGRVRYRQRGKLINYICNVGYIIAGERFITCRNGVWDSSPPKCVRASCIKVSSPINGYIYPSHRGAVLNFFCKSGFYLRGPNATYCDGTFWDNYLPTCMETNTLPSLSCDFESPNLCGWNQDLRHDFDWTRMNLKTPSGHLGTGPSFDHTKGEGGTGYYMYIESSSRQVLDKARLISPVYNKMNDTDVCFEFYYHMHGSNIGELRVYLRKESEDWNLDPNRAMFQKQGNHGDVWLHSLNFLGPIDEDFQIVIEAIRGTSYISDIAIDDVRIIQNCSFDITAATTEMEVLYTDDYEHSFQSCINRCDNDSVTSPIISFQRPCNCNDNCLDNNTCCPDYIAICILGNDDDIMESSIEKYTTNITVINSSTSAQNITKPTTFTTSTKTSVIPQTMTPITTTKSTTTTTPITTTTISSSTTTTTSATTTSTTTTTTAIPKPLIISTSESELLINDMVTLPTVTEEEIGPYFTLKSSNLTPATILNSTKAIISSLSTTIVESKTKYITISIVSICCFLFIILIAVFVFKRFKFRGCRDISKLKGYNSDSQSDVRFLTSDEILNFNLAFPDD